jgi:hypothetical protein
MEGKLCTKTSYQDVLETLSTFVSQCMKRCMCQVTPYKSSRIHGSESRSYLISEPRIDPGCYRIQIRNANFSTVTFSELSLLQDSHGFEVTIV